MSASRIYTQWYNQKRPIRWGKFGLNNNWARTYYILLLHLGYLTHRLRQVIYKHRTHDSCQSKNPAKSIQSEIQQTVHSLNDHKWKTEDYMMTWRLPVIIYIWLPNTFKSFSIKVKHRSSYSINIHFYRGSPYPNPCKRQKAFVSMDRL